MNANISHGEEAVSGAFGMGMDYFMANAEQRKEIAANATTLEKDEWETLSETMIGTYRREAYAVEHLRNAGLTRDISLATKVDLWQKHSPIDGPEISMDGESRSGEDRLVYDYEGVPVPILHKDFRIGQRDLQSSRNLGNDLRTDTIAEATEVVTKGLDDLVFNGWEAQVGDSKGNAFELYGYRTHPDRNQYSGSDWGTADNIRDDIVGILDTLDEENRDAGDFTFYLAPEQWREFRSAVDPDGDGNQTVRRRVMNEFDQELGDVHRAHDLTNGEAVMVDMSPDVVELGVAEDVQMIEWQSGSGMTNHFKVMAAMAPEIKSDRDGRSGIVHATGL